MKKLLVLVLALALLVSCVCAISETDVASMASAAGLEITTSDNTDGEIFCDYTVDNSNKSSMKWSDAAHLYSVSGDTAVVSQLYVDALSLGGWESCRYILGKKARVSFGAKSKKVCDSLDDYLDQMETTLGVTATGGASVAASTDVQQYVLNTNTKKFHYPSCSSVSQMKAKNRKDFTGTREEIIAMGYDPCGNCHP